MTIFNISIRKRKISKSIPAFWVAKTRKRLDTINIIKNTHTHTPKSKYQISIHVFQFLYHSPSNLGRLHPFSRPLPPIPPEALTSPESVLKSKTIISKHSVTEINISQTTRAGAGSLLLCYRGDMRARLYLFILNSRVTALAFGIYGNTGIIFFFSGAFHKYKYISGVRVYRNLYVHIVLRAGTAERKSQLMVGFGKFMLFFFKM